MHNADITDIFDQVADLLEIQGANPFRVRAYRNAARVIGNWPGSFSDLLNRGEEFPKVPGLGEDLAGKVGEICKTGHLRMLEDLKKMTPEGLLLLLRLPGLGPKRVKLLQKKLKVRSVDDLKRVLRSGRLRELRGFGPKIEGRLLQELAGGRGAEKPRVKLPVAEQIASALLSELRNTRGISQLEAAGSFRRRQETVGDLDILASCDDPEISEELMDRFVHHEDVRETLARGKTRSTVILRSGFQVDLRVVPVESFGAALHYFTGSKAHNIAVRALGVRRGLKINEYGIFRGTRRLGGESEEDVFRSVGLPWIEPELRENRGEIEAAREGKLPVLVTLGDIRGDLHAHTRETDGRATLEAMAKAARSRGYEYLAVSDHSRRLAMTRGLTPARLRQQARQIERLNTRLNAKGKFFTLLRSCEVDILEDGSLDLPDETLALLDFTVCSVHSHFGLTREKQTERIIRAMDHPYFDILGHPTGRLIGERAPYDLDLERILRAARERGCIVEVNAQPDRMDLSDVYCKMAKQIGVRLAISTDAHSENDLAYMSYGVSQARRGWLEKADVFNARPWREARKLLRRRG